MKKRLACWGMALLMLWGGQAMAQSAVVDNGSDPSSRLNMRDQPSKDAGSVGQFYTGTPSKSFRMRAAAGRQDDHSAAVQTA